jgi:hypothetical protein
MVQVIAGVAGEDLMGEGKAVTIDRKANAELLAVGAFINSSSNLSNRLAVSTALLHRDPHVLQVDTRGRAKAGRRSALVSARSFPNRASTPSSTSAPCCGRMTGPREPDVGARWIHDPTHPVGRSDRCMIFEKNSMDVANL